MPFQRIKRRVSGKPASHRSTVKLDSTRKSSILDKVRAKR